MHTHGMHARGCTQLPGSPPRFLGTQLEETQVSATLGGEQGAPLRRELIKGPRNKETWCLQDEASQARRHAWGPARRVITGLRAEELLWGSPRCKGRQVPAWYRRQNPGFLAKTSPSQLN